MAATGIDKLTVSKVRRINKPGRYGDGKGLYLQVSKALTKSWVFRYQRGGIEHAVGLGPTHTIGLADARRAARKARALLIEGIDPLEVKKASIEERKEWDAKQITFSECSAEYIASHQDGWRSEKHKQQWISTLQTYTNPYFGNTPVSKIDTQQIMEVLKPIWVTKTETAARLRERIERVLSFAATSGYRWGENPARWRGHLAELLPNPSRVRKTRHYQSMKYQDIGAFFQRLQAEECTAARALELTILTACRSGEVHNAQWSEIDFVHRTWTIPGTRTKSGCEHRVPLANASLKILRGQVGQNKIKVFPGVSGSSMLAFLRELTPKATVHGFRSTFRVWAAEMTTYPREVAERALAHSIGNAVEMAYLRSDLFNKRKKLMRDWAAWCTTVPEDEPPACSPDKQEFFQI
jgi:integrase